MYKITLIILVFILNTLISAQLVDLKDKDNGSSNGKANGKANNGIVDSSGKPNGNNKGKGRGKNAKFLRLKKVRVNKETFGQTLKREHKKRSGKPNQPNPKETNLPAQALDNSNIDSPIPIDPIIAMNSPTDSPFLIDSTTPMDSTIPIDSTFPIDSPTSIDSPVPIDSPAPIDSPGKSQNSNGKNKKKRLLVSQSVQNKLNTFQSSPSIPITDINSSSLNGPFLGRMCKYQSMKYSNPTNEFLHFSSNNADIYPGSVIMSKNLNGVLDGSLSQMGVPAAAKLKNPTIQIYDQLTPSVITSNYSNAAINQKISQTIAASVPLKEDYTIYFEMGTTDDLSDFANRLNFNQALFKQIGVDVNPSLPLTSYKKKMIFIFTKPIGTFDTMIQSQPSNLPNTPLNTFYSPALTLNEFNSRIPSWWSTTNPPVYIDSVVYGSLLILTVQINPATSALYNQFEAAAENGPSAVQPILNSIIADPSLKVFSRGPFNSIQIQTIRNGDWLDFLLEVPNSITNSFIQPLTYSVKSFKQARYNGANQFTYIKVCP